jgi:hypothetical protein
MKLESAEFEKNEAIKKAKELESRENRLLEQITKLHEVCSVYFSQLISNSLNESGVSLSELGSFPDKKWIYLLCNNQEFRFTC